MYLLLLFSVVENNFAIYITINQFCKALKIKFHRWEILQL